MQGKRGTPGQSYHPFLGLSFPLPRQLDHTRAGCISRLGGSGICEPFSSSQAQPLLLPCLGMSGDRIGMQVHTQVCSWLREATQRCTDVDKQITRECTVPVHTCQATGRQGRVEWERGREEGKASVRHTSTSEHLCACPHVSCMCTNAWLQTHTHTNLLRPELLKSVPARQPELGASSKAELAGTPQGTGQGPRNREEAVRKGAGEEGPNLGRSWACPSPFLPLLTQQSREGRGLLGNNPSPSELCPFPLRALPTALPPALPGPQDSLGKDPVPTLPRDSESPVPCASATLAPSPGCLPTARRGLMQPSTWPPAWLLTHSRCRWAGAGVPLSVGSNGQGHGFAHHPAGWVYKHTHTQIHTLVGGVESCSVAREGAGRKKGGEEARIKGEGKAQTDAERAKQRGTEQQRGPAECGNDRSRAKETRDLHTPPCCSPPLARETGDAGLADTA